MGFDVQKAFYYHFACTAYAAVIWVQRSQNATHAVTMNTP